MQRSRKCSIVLTMNHATSMTAKGHHLVGGIPRPLRISRSSSVRVRRIARQSHSDPMSAMGRKWTFEGIVISLPVHRHDRRPTYGWAGSRPASARWFARCPGLGRRRKPGHGAPGQCVPTLTAVPACDPDWQTARTSSRAVCPFGQLPARRLSRPASERNGGEYEVFGAPSKAPFCQSEHGAGTKDRRVRRSLGAENCPFGSPQASGSRSTRIPKDQGFSFRAHPSRTGPMVDQYVGPIDD
jgi:hypothetical protein